MALYRSSGIKPPTIKDLENISEQHKLNVTTAEIEQYKESIDGFLEKNYQHLEDICDDPLPVKYPRTPGYKPSPEENKLNAWYCKTDISGASTGKLFGKKLAIKDNIFVAGVPMTNGSQFLTGFVPNEDATVVTRVLDAGGRILGKANCEHLCFSGSSSQCCMGPVLNPIDTSRSAGGSSSGCAVLCQTGEVDMAIGGDQGGSVRTPSSWCGTVAIKPTYGLVPYTGAMPIEPSIDHLGPITKTVKDCALLLEVIAGYDDGRDFRQPRDITVPPYSEKLTGDIKGLKIGLLKEGFVGCEEDVINIIKGTKSVFESLGATVEEVSVPEHVEAHHVWMPIGFEGSYKTMMQNATGMLGVKSHQNVACIEHLRAGYISKNSIMPPSVKMMYFLGAYITENYGLGYYAKAQNILRRLVKGFDAVFEKIDVLIMPTLPYKAPKHPQADISIKELIDHCSAMESNTAPYDATGHPAMTLNAGYSEGLPIGLQIVGNHWNESTVLNVGYAFEQHISK